jgi:hypothetical protein
MLTLIIGGRFGSSFKGTPKSVTNAEYREAARLKIPIFALVEQGALGDLHMYASNRSNQRLAAKMKFPSVDSTAIFAFIEEVRSNAVNNALVPFRDFADIESYLRQQWAGMMFSFLAGANQSARVAATLSVMQEMSERIEMLSRQANSEFGWDRSSEDDGGVVRCDAITRRDQNTARLELVYYALCRPSEQDARRVRSGS